ncbi:MULTISPECIES: IclR family transcriptional regulator [Streptomyces]|uniref:IclR family transcriptional regulator n=1 Tax=Streptomyces solicathayae TaxID=3081768 RepID=A0ABZ0M2X2_9ACTN|nr:IclR family transcriptional regulator [Streptomyces sp. HUAS YS2]WOX25996.1 IclR family transcriptional regulator [Streptomyces sp. HUAS YS2]
MATDDNAASVRARRREPGMIRKTPPGPPGSDQPGQPRGPPGRAPPYTSLVVPTDLEICARMKVVSRALRVLHELAQKECGATLSELAHEAEIPVSSMHRILQALQAEGLVSRSQRNHRYFLGPAAQPLANEATRRPLSPPPPEATELARASGERVLLSELFDDRVICTAVAVPERHEDLNLFAQAGQPMPLHASASARILLAFRPTAEVRGWLQHRPLTRFTATTPRTVDEVVERLERTRTLGYDESPGELQPGIWAVGVPLRTSTGRVCAGLTIAARAEHAATPERRTELLELVRGSAREISAGLGYDG